MDRTPRKPDPPSAGRSRGRTTGLVIAWTLAVVIVVPVVAVVGYGIYLATPQNGDRIAEREAADTAAVIADEAVVPLHNSNGVLHAEQIAESVFLEQPDPRLADERNADVTVEVLGWDGTTNEADGARVDVRIEVVVHGGSAGALFTRDRSAGHAVRCYRLTVGYYEYDEAAGLAPIDCPAPGSSGEFSTAPDPAAPWKVESASSPKNEKRLLGLLSEAGPDSNEASVLAALEEAFPDHTVAVRREGDELAASVMGPGHRDCLVGVRVGDDEPFRYTDFPRVQLEIGELGCVPGLYWSNVTAH
ncbi:hypothetical protein [Myceligenerans pegani]|uniref:Uncharacterized protein n=1 Tax=Myceligenerans pegani TaxID=2776917 RepID=A0ABR9MUM7_9MICO|nr:hypothetical protein [Myceligenerans sp. TRM 65318]MBE1875072.1 hypothetical protein [Myceligenerans sp. TRM 65318]MBE3017343.1 hypothetical protein [Myceligenerans sp. TRM 65318]